MKQMVCVLVFVLAPTVFAAPLQTVPAESASQASRDSVRSTSNRATSHDRHMRNHRTGNRHHRHRPTARSHNP
jgi:Ni/Co efflux regulator RcnB